MKAVRVNGRDAKAVAASFGQWEVMLEHIPLGELRLTAAAGDEAGNVEKTGHRVVVRIDE